MSSAVIGEGESHSGAGAHVGIVGEDGKVYNHGLAPDPNNPGQRHEEWTQGDITRWIKEEYTDGIVVLRTGCRINSRSRRAVRVVDYFFGSLSSTHF